MGSHKIKQENGRCNFHAVGSRKEFLKRKTCLSRDATISSVVFRVVHFALQPDGTLRVLRTNTRNEVIKTPAPPGSVQHHSIHRVLVRRSLCVRLCLYSPIKRIVCGNYMLERRKSKNSVCPSFPKGNYFVSP